MEFKDRLKLARKRLKMNQTALAKAVGLDQTSISDLERGKSRTSGYTAQLAQALKVNPHWLATGEGEMELGRSPAPATQRPDEVELHPTEVVEEGTPLRRNEVELPYYREVELAAGDGRTQVIENHGNSRRFRIAYLQRAGVQPENAACATVKGTSMEPTIKDGSPIAIDRGCTQVIDGKIYALDHGGMLRVKRLYRLPMNRLRLVSDNDVEYREEVYSPGEVEEIRIIGRVFWWEVFD